MQLGKVILAGAGCGDPELVTLKTARYLQHADVILSDYLASHEIIEQHANKQAAIIHVGKQCKSGIKTSQKTINELLVAYAQQGKLVVRLKGGDATLFANSYDELQALTANGISFEIVPGVTSALGAAAYAGIPLTARGYATAVRLITFYGAHTIDAAQWTELAHTNDTLVFYMSSDKLNIIAQQLQVHGVSTQKKLALIEQATTPHQQVRLFNLASLAQHPHEGTVVSPALIIVGSVVTLHESFRWFSPTANPQINYFTQHIQ